MKDTSIPGSVATAPPANGTHRSNKKTPAAKRNVQAEISAPFLLAEAAPIDAPMWPLHSSLWLQPDPSPTVPERSDLSIEHQNRIPAPGFIAPEVRPVDCSGAAEGPSDILAARACPRIPEDGLTVLGWDPRAVCFREERE